MPRRVVAKIEQHLGELFPRVGFVVTKLPMVSLPPRTGPFCIRAGRGQSSQRAGAVPGTGGA